jgi:hypothetical protein
MEELSKKPVVIGDKRNMTTGFGGGDCVVYPNYFINASRQLEG